MRNIKLSSILSIILFIVIALFYSKIPQQDPVSYFSFADNREFWGIPCYWNVISNLIFFAAGIYGFKTYFICLHQLKGQESQAPKFLYLALSLGIFFTAFGSAYFHLNPLVSTVFWDRLPMLVVFTSVISILVTDKFGSLKGLLSFFTLLTLSTCSLILWKFNFIDLRPYFVFQYGGILFLVIQLLFNKSGKISNSQFAFALFIYVLAKIFERYDHNIFLYLTFASGHTIKHILAGGAILLLQFRLRDNLLSREQSL